MQNRTSNVFWHREHIALARAPSEFRAAVSKRAERHAGSDRNLQTLVHGLIYVALFCSLLFAEVYVRTQMKSRGLEIWTLARRKAEIESEMTRLDMRLTVLESPMRLETLASSEIGLVADHPQKETPPQTP